MSHDGKWNRHCLIERAVADAEDKLKDELAHKTIADILNQRQEKISVQLIFILIIDIKGL